MLGATQTFLRNMENRINLKPIVCNGINKYDDDDDTGRRYIWEKIPRATKIIFATRDE